MYAHFGHKWLCLFWGPTWQYEEESQVQQTGKEVDVLEMALNISDISLLEGNVVEAEMETGDDGEECTSTKKGKGLKKRKMTPQQQAPLQLMCLLFGHDLTNKMWLKSQRG